MDKWIIIHQTHLLPNPFMTQPAHLPPLAVSFDSLLEPYPYIDVDDVVGHKPNWWRGNVDHESASWSNDLVGNVNPIYVVE